MAKGHFLQTNFTGGEWSPLLEGRVDLQKYVNSVYKLENFLLYPHGPAQYRPGFRYIHQTKDNGYSRLIPFEFSVEQAYQLEFGNTYIRFYKNQGIITKTAQNITNISKANPAVVTYSGSDTYANGDRVIISGVAGMIEVNNREFTVANINVGANTFELSGVNSSSYTTYTSGGTAAEIYEVTSPYATTDIDYIKYCQSADVLYLFHPNYATRKLSRAGDTSWTLSTINFNPPAVDEVPIEPNATLTPSATTGDSVTFTAGSSVFLSGDVGRVIQSGAGRASIIAYTSGTVVTCAIIDDFTSTDPIAAGLWEIQGSPNGSLTPSIKSPVGAIVALDSTAGSETFTNLLEEDSNHWNVSGSGTNEYYLKNTAPFYSSTKPDRVYLNSVQAVEGSLGTLGIVQWGWGNNDTLGYNTIYVRLSDGADPDSKSPLGSPNNSYVKKSTIVASSSLFRSTDVGKYISINNGFIKITQYVSAIQIKGEIRKELSTITASTSWTLESNVWTATEGYPTAGTFFEDRFCLVRNESTWGSVVGDYENFTPGADDSDSISFTLAGRQVNVIRWIEPRDYLILGTAGNEWRLGPENTGTPITPTNVIAKQQTTFGCDDIMPVTIGQSTLFVQRAGRKIREFTYNFESDGYVAPDMTQLAEHITESGIFEMAYQQEPLSIVWAITMDGGLIGMTYLRAEEVVGWHRHPVDGTVESISVIPGDGYDELWAIINRTINGQTVRYVEMLERIFNDDDSTFQSNKGLNAFFVDSGLTYNGASTTTISGLWHLNGETVSVLANGGVQANKIVSNGKITLDSAATVCHVGLPYTGKIQLMRLDMQLQDGTVQGRIKKTSEIITRIYRSGTFKIGRDENNLDVVSFRTSDMEMGSPPTLYTGDKRINYDGRFSREDRIMLVQDKPLPLTLIAVMTEVGIS